MNGTCFSNIARSEQHLISVLDKADEREAGFQALAAIALAVPGTKHGPRALSKHLPQIASHVLAALQDKNNPKVPSPEPCAEAFLAALDGPRRVGASASGCALTSVDAAALADGAGGH